MEVTPLLPDDASQWSTQLCSSYFNSLTDELKARMENDNCVMPALNNLNNKKVQIDALQIVREKSSAAFKKLNDETKLIKQIMLTSGGTAPHRTGVQFITEAAEREHHRPPTPSAVPPAGILLYGQQSPAEETIAKYRSKVPNTLNLPLKEGAGGLMYPLYQQISTQVQRLF